MRPAITMLTLGVDDLDRSLTFYRDGMGLKTDGIVGTEFENGAVVFLDLEGGIKLALWPRKSIAVDTGLPLQAGGTAAFTIGHNVFSRDEVNAVMDQALAAGAHLVKAAADTFYGGYAAYFTDPDGHLWEVAYNPGMLPAQ